MAKSGYLIRLRVGGDVRLECMAPATLTAAQFAKRKRDLETLRNDLLPLGDHAKVHDLLREVAKSATPEEAGLAARLALRYVREHKATAKVAPGVPTFQEFSLRWAKNELALDPRYAAYKSKLWQEPETTRCNLSRLSYINRVIGHIPMTRLTEAKCREAVSPSAVSPRVKTSTALRQYYQVIQTVCQRAVSPCGIITSKEYPLPLIGWLPPISTPPSYAILYPHDDAKLLANVELPLWRRLLYGMDVREGLRAAHLLRLKYSNIDFDNGIITIGKGKNNKNARQWELAPGVAAALHAFRGDAKATDFIFPQLDANEMLELAEGVRADLIASGVNDKVRPDLHASGDGMEPFRFQDLRQTAVAFWLAKDWSESKIMLRTQHTTSQVMQKHYGRKKEIARSVLAKQGDFLPLDVALGFNKEAPRVGDKVGDKNEHETNSSMITGTPGGNRTPDPRIRNPLTGHPGIPEAQKPREKRHQTAQENSIPHPQGGGWGILDSADKSELKALYDLANASERWDLAASLLKRLQALPTDSNVTSIDSARRKRGK
jgi:integrase